jgi:cytochrome P450
MWLIRTPHAYKRLTEEIRSSFSDAKSMTFLELQELSYMNACIDEGLRIFPPVPTGLTRTVPEDGDTVADEFIPGGTTVSVYSWAAAHSPNNFARPDEFVPERWIEEAYAGDQKDASQAFSLGPRGCIGKHLSYLELRLILANLLWHFDVQRADTAAPVDIWDPAADLKHVKAFNTWSKPPLMCKLTPVRR